MQRECQLMDNGDVYEIQRDGTIHKVGNINSRPAPDYSRSRNAEKIKKWLWAVSIIGGLSIIGLIIPLVIVSDELDYARGRWNHYADLYYAEKEEADDAKSELASFKSTVTQKYPIIIHDIEIGNTYKDGSVQTEYGNRIYDYNTMYLMPKIYYTGLESGDYTLKVKWYQPDGKLSQGTSSPSGFSQSEQSYFNRGNNNTKYLRGWGNSTPGNWEYGTYWIEIWYEDVCLKAKTFRIY